MAGRPAATLLHLGPGLGNGLANLHNARRARTPIVNLVGDHATYHKKFDAPLESDIEGVARNVSPGFVRWGSTPATLGADTVEAVRAAVGPPARSRPSSSRPTCRGARAAWWRRRRRRPGRPGVDDRSGGPRSPPHCVGRRAGGAPPRQRRARPAALTAASAAAGASGAAR